MKGRGLCNVSVILAVGLPIKWIGEQGESFRKYLLKNKEVTFRYNDTRYHVKIEDVEVYAQGFAADIGNGTRNINFAKLDQNKVRFIEDIHANAKGHEYLSNYLMRSDTEPYPPIFHKWGMNGV